MALEAIEDLRVFDAIARTGSLSAAAREMAVSLSLVSTKLKRLEAGLGIRLVHRTTRQMSLTGEGLAFLDRCRNVLEAVAAAEELGADDTIRGVVRVTASVALAQRQIGPRLPRFLDLHPEIEVQVIASERLVDLVEQKVDVAFRQTALGESSFVTRTIAPDGRVLCASPNYVARFGMPEAPQDLSRHRCLTVGDPPPVRWTLARGGEEIDVPIRSALSSTDGEVPHAAALADGGIAMKSSWDVIDDIRSGRLIRVLPEWWGMTRALRVVQPVRMHRPQRVRAFVDFLEAELKAAVRANADLGLFPEGRQ